MAMRWLGCVAVLSLAVSTARDAQAQVTITPKELDFGAVRVDNAAVLSTTRTFNISNEGTAAITVTGLAFTTAGTEFVNVPPPGVNFEILPGANFDFTVRFNPAQAGMRSNGLTVTTSASAAETVQLTGIGTTAIIGVTDVAFGVVGNGTTSPANILVSNTSSSFPGVLRVTNAVISGGDGWFSFDANGGGCAGQATCGFGGGFDIGPGAPQLTRNVGVRCSPPAGASGTRTATVQFGSDSDANTDDTSMLSCTAGRADIGVSTTSLAYGSVVVGESLARSVTVSNTGNSTLLYTVSKSGATNGQFTLSGCHESCSVLPGSSQIFTLTYVPTTLGNAAVALSIASNDPDVADNPLAISITARGIASQIAGPLSVAFGDLDVGKAGTQMLSISNTGEAPLLITNTSFQTGAAADYTVTAGPHGNQMTTVAPGGTASWTLRCSPSAMGNRDTNFRILSNSFTSGTLNVPLTCRGMQGILAVSPASHNFGPTPENTVKTQAFTLRNDGNVQVTGISAVVAPLMKGYSLVAPPPATLAAGATAMLTARFAPLSGTDGDPATITFTGSWSTMAPATTTTAVFHMNGDGLTTGYDVSPALVQFGSLRFDAIATQTFCIINSSEAEVAILPMTVVTGAGTTTGELAITLIRKPAAGVQCNGTGATVGLGATTTLQPNERLEVTVRADPANRIGPLNGTITVNSNLGITRVVTLAATSITGTLSLTPGAALELGTVDVQGAPVTQLLTISNTGDAVLDLTGFTRGTGSAPEFAFTLPPNTNLQPGASIQIPVTYTPTTARAPGSEDTATLAHAIAGDLSVPAMMSVVTMRARGIDRTLEVTDTPVFPDTFRNPGSTAPVRPVTITNTGEAPLDISAVMVSNDPEVWELTNPAPVVVAPGASHDFLVRFLPTRPGRAPDAALHLVNDDVEGGPPITPRTTVVDLRGNGRDRAVMFAPFGDGVNVGYTGIGVPVTIEGALQVTNMDPDATHRIREIRLDGAEVFTIAGAPAGIDVPPMETATFAVSFDPTEQGVFIGTAVLFLDEDTQAQAQVKISGHAVYVDARGGGGCAVGGGADGAGGLAVIALAAVVGIARRRRRARRRGDRGARGARRAGRGGAPTTS